MYSFRKIAYRFFQANKFIIISSILSIAIATILILTMTLYSISAHQKMEDEMTALYGTMDMAVGFDAELEKVLTEPFIQQIEQNDSIQELSKVYVTHLQLDQQQMEVYTVGVENDQLAKGRYHFDDSLQKDEVILNKDLAETLGLQIGDQVSIENTRFTLSEFLNEGETGSPDMLILHHDTVKSFVKDEEQSVATFLLVKANANADVLQLSNELKLMEGDLRIDLVEEEEFVKSNLGSLTIYLIVISVLVLFVTGILINSNFELLIYKITNQFAIMRSIGASSKQLGKIMVLQGLGINIAGVSLGFLTTFICYQYIFRLIEKSFHLPTTTGDFYVGFASFIAFVFFVLIQLFIMIPVMKGSRILPLKLLQQNEKLDFRFSNGRKIVFRILLGIVVFLIIFSQVMPKREETGVYVLLVAALLLLVGLFFMLPVHITVFFNKVAGPVGKLFGSESLIAIKNLIPQVKKNTFVILAITVFMIISVFGSTMLNTIYKNEGAYLETKFITPIIIESRLGYETKMVPQELSQQLENTDSVDGTYSLSTFGVAEINVDNNYETFDYRLADLNRMETLDEIPPITGENLANTLVISKTFAEKYDLKPGDGVDLGLFSEAAQEVQPMGVFHVGAVANELVDQADIYMDWSNPVFNNEYTVFESLYVKTTNEKDTLQTLNTMKSMYPEMKVSSYLEAEKEKEQQFLQRWSIFMMILSALLITTIIGVYISLTNNIVSKRKEFAILRSLGTKPSGIRKIITTQVYAYILIGIGYGLMIGTLFTLIIYLIDPSQVSIEYLFLLLVILFILIATRIFTFFLGRNISNRKLRDEVWHDNK